jgi:carbon storage regulator CsrA
MLVLTRKKRESVAIGTADGREPVMTVTVLRIGNGTVKLGFDGNPSISVHRGELVERMRGLTDESTDAATPTP